MEIFWAALVLGAMGLLFGLLLTGASKLFAVPSNPKRDAVRELILANLAAASASGAATVCGYRFAVLLSVRLPRWRCGGRRQGGFHHGCGS